MVAMIVWRTIGALFWPRAYAAALLKVMEMVPVVYTFLYYQQKERKPVVKNQNQNQESDLVHPSLSYALYVV